MKRTGSEIAAIIDRFVSDECTYPQEWNDFVDTRIDDAELDRVRRRCEELDPIVNCPGGQDRDAMNELQAIASKLKKR